MLARSCHGTDAAMGGRSDRRSYRQNKSAGCRRYTTLWCGVCAGARRSIGSGAGAGCHCIRSSSGCYRARYGVVADGGLPTAKQRGRTGSRLEFRVCIATYWSLFVGLRAGLLQNGGGACDACLKTRYWRFARKRPWRSCRVESIARDPAKRLAWQLLMST